jgi:hypothetical protein
MGMALTNARLAGGSTHIQKITPARTSIAEDAIFIPKPYDRADFKIVGKGQMPEANLPGSGNANGSPAADGNLKMGSLGKNGLTASLTKASYSARANHVEIEYDYTPEKDFDAIAPQEEGRQTNNAQTTHYSQQYDAYGRPRIGFSREPYDFAATKYIHRTSEIRLLENVESSRAAFAYADMRNQKNNPAENPEVELSPMARKIPESPTAEEGGTPYNPIAQPLYEKGTLGETPINLPGSKDASAPEGMKPLNYDKLPGNKRPGDIKPENTGEKPKTKPTGMSPRELAEKMGVNFKEILSPANRGSASEAHDVLPEKLSNKLVSIMA